MLDNKKNNNNIKLLIIIIIYYYEVGLPAGMTQESTAKLKQLHFTVTNRTDFNQKVTAIIPRGRIVVR